MIENLTILNEENTKELLQSPLVLDKEKSKELTGYPHIDKPWQQFYTEEAINAEVPPMTIYEWIFKNNAHRMNEVAISYFGKTITYNQLKEKIDNAASAFIKMGVKKGDIVTLMMPNIPENTAAIYALNKIGAIANMVDLRAKDDELLYYLNEVDSKVVVTTDLFLDNINQIEGKTNVEHIIVASPADSLPIGIKQLYKLKTKDQKLELDDKHCLWKEFEELGQQYFIDFQEPFEENRGACILHTSGTTGRPKGVVLTNENFNSMIIEYKYSGLEFETGDKFFSQVPPFLAYNVILATHLPLSLGIKIIMVPDYQPEKFAENIMKYKTEHAIAGPADWENFLHNPKVYKKAKGPFKLIRKNRFKFLKTLASGGDKFNEQTKQNVNELLASQGCEVQVIEGYGMTEAGSATCTNLPNCNNPKSVGVPLPKMNICIYDNDQEEELQYNQIGEICFSGPTVMKEYFENETETSKTLKQHADGQIWLHSGDLGYVTEEGIIYIEGRSKRIIVRHDGLKVSPFEIENVILENENVENCCVVAIPDTEHNRGSIPAANIVLKDNIEQSEEEVLKDIQNLCFSKLIEIHMPQKYILVKELPLTKVGKVDYRALEKQSELTSEKTKKVYKKELK